jgi:hypothetical protein
MLTKNIDQSASAVRRDGLASSAAFCAALLESGLLFYLATLTRPAHGEAVFTVYAVLSGLACLGLAGLVRRM